MPVWYIYFSFQTKNHLIAPSASGYLQSSRFLWHLRACKLALGYEYQNRKVTPREQLCQQWQFYFDSISGWTKGGLTLQRYILCHMVKNWV